MPSIYVTKTDGERELYSSDKLCDSMIRSGASPKTANHICEMVEQGLEPGMTTQRIWRATLRHLVKENLRASARYSLRRAMASLGPDGFSFERFVEALMEAHGYKTKRNQVLVGASGVRHEVDVLATKDKDTVCFIEVKYKNEYGLRTHIDTVMYSHARYLDMMAGEQQQSKNQNKKYEVWLVTNTEFTKPSIQYGQYHHMRLVGWNYPKKHSLEDMVMEKSLYPVTILPTLTRNDRKAFIAEGHVLAQDLLLYSSKDLQQQFKIPEKRAKQIVEELEGLLK